MEHHLEPLLILLPTAPLILHLDLEKYLRAD
jgi:hypothetical protein